MTNNLALTGVQTEAHSPDKLHEYDQQNKPQVQHTNSSVQAMFHVTPRKYANCNTVNSMTIQLIQYVVPYIQVQ